MSQPTGRQAALTAPAVAESPPVPAVDAPAAVAGRSPDASPIRRPAPSTPHQLQRLSAGVVALGVVVALVGLVTFGALAAALGRAQSDTAQLVRVQSIATNLLSADASATNAFLVGGLEPPAQRASYDRALSETGALIAQAARAQPADAAALAVLNQQVLDYDGAVEQARANNRQGFPVGAQYLRLASGQLRSQALPVLDELVAANADRADQRMGVAWGYLFPVVCLLALAGLVVAQVALARRFHRRINPGLLVASTVLLVALVASLVGMAVLRNHVETTRTGSFALVNAAAGARIGANNAKANESLTLIARGSGQSFEQAWTRAGQQVEAQLDALDDARLSAAWDGYAQVHRAIRSLDDGGRWDQAVQRATGSGPTSANVRFAELDSGLTEALHTNSGATTAALGRERPALVVAALLSLLAGLAASLLGRRGVAARLREYR
ncbi:MAG: hypothetical protein ACJ72K_13960 [Friedmanniella sp.]